MINKDDEIPIVVNTYCSKGTICIVNKGKPDVYILTDSIGTLLNAICELSEFSDEKFLKACGVKV